MPTKRKPYVKQRKSVRLASKRKHPVVSLDDDSSTYTSCKPKKTTPSSQKPDVHHHQPQHLIHQVLVSLVLLIPQFLPILSLINCRFFSLSCTLCKMKCTSSLHHSLISLHKQRLVSVPSLIQWRCRQSMQTKMNLLFHPSPYCISLMMLHFIKQTT